MITAHELAHVVRLNWIPTDDELPPSVDAAQIEIEAWCVAGPPPPDCRPIPWVAHDALFVRLLLHIVHRLRTALEWRFLAEIGHEAYGISPLWRYQSALGDEPHRLAYLPLTSIGNIVPPEAFIELWRHDLKQWFMAIDSPTDFQVAALLRGAHLFPPSQRRNDVCYTVLQGPIGMETNES